jgi:hypothetical protein
MFIAHLMINELQILKLLSKLLAFTVKEHCHKLGDISSRHVL